jgi:hypothetical protein
MVIVDPPAGPAMTQKPSTEGTQEATFEDTDEVTTPPALVVVCPLDAFECPSGDFVGRIPPSCVFDSCPEKPGTNQPVPAVTQKPSMGGTEEATVEDTEEETQEATVEDTDEKTSPPGPVVCPLDVFECPSGEPVGRIPPYCVFDACPEQPGICTQDIMECPNGGFVGRDPEKDCAFFACPIYDIPTELPLRESLCTTQQRCGLCDGDCQNDSQVSIIELSTHR